MRYSKWNNFCYVVKNWFRWDKPGTFLAFLRIPITVLVPVLSSLLLKWMVRGISQQVVWTQFAIVLALIFSGWLACSMLDKALETKLDMFQFQISTHYAIEMMEKLVNMDYEVLENYEGRSLYQRCKKFAFEGAQSDGAWAAVRLTGLLTSILGIVTYGVMFVKVSPWLIQLVFVTCGVEYISYYKIIAYGNKAVDEMNKPEMIFYYLFCQATDIEVEKDIHLSGASRWLLDHLKRAVLQYEKSLHWYTNKATSMSILQACCTLVRDAGIFILLVQGVRTGALQVDEFLFYFSLITGFSQWLNGISGHISSLGRISMECDYYRRFLELPERESEKDGCILDDIQTITFEDVSFAYDDGQPVLKHINLSLKRGDQIAIVGENGAGKTTLIKLLCGLYCPTKGVIKINGRPLLEYQRRSLYQQMSAIFQDYMLLPVSMEKNVAADETWDENRMEKVLRQVNLFDKRGEEGGFSGGEKQRLLLARALYKEAPLLILDEPTAALDPIAEEALYQQYREFCGDGISVFVSHRLNSTRFCNRILYLDEGQILEEGTHEELLQKNGAYKQMYNVQGYYYRGGALV